MEIRGAGKKNRKYLKVVKNILLTLYRSSSHFLLIHCLQNKNKKRKLTKHATFYGMILWTFTSTETRRYFSVYLLNRLIRWAKCKRNNLLHTAKLKSEIIMYNRLVKEIISLKRITYSFVEIEKLFLIKYMLLETLWQEVQ